MAKSQQQPERGQDRCEDRPEECLYMHDSPSRCVSSAPETFARRDKQKIVSGESELFVAANYEGIT